MSFVTETSKGRLYCTTELTEGELKLDYLFRKALRNQADAFGALSKADYSRFRVAEKPRRPRSERIPHLKRGGLNKHTF